MGVSQSEGYLEGGPHFKDYGMLGSILGSHFFRETTNCGNPDRLLCIGKFMAAAFGGSMYVWRNMVPIPMFSSLSSRGSVTTSGVQIKGRAG